VLCGQSDRQVIRYNDLVLGSLQARVTGGPRSSNASSSADALDRTDANYMDRIDADYPNDGTNSDGFDTDRACLLIHGSHLLGGDEYQGAEVSTVVGDLGRAVACPIGRSMPALDTRPSSSGRTGQVGLR